MRALVVASSLAVALVAGTAAAGADEHKCEREAAGFAGVKIVGAFAYDRGCAWQSYVLAGKPHALLDAGVLLAREGWGKADAAARAVLAQRYVIGVMLTGVDESTASNDLGTDYTPPAAKSGADGLITVTAWNRLPPGMRPERRYALHEVRFGPDGNIKGARIVQTIVR
jgi:hypothetical protein